MTNRPRMRTLPQAAAELKAADPETAISLSTLRLLVKRGEIPVVQIRNRQLVNMETLCSILAGGSSRSTTKRDTVRADERGTVRKIEV